MKQMNMDGLEVITVDYDSHDLPAVAKIFKPVIYKDGTAYCCLLGPDPQAGIFGCGETPKEAVIDWEAHLQAGLVAGTESEGIIQYIKKRLEEIIKGDA
ncbi:MAG: hypothetical protein ACTHLE_04225 [Agriterribacter sp.]